MVQEKDLTLEKESKEGYEVMPLNGAERAYRNPSCEDRGTHSTAEKHKRAKLASAHKVPSGSQG